MRVHQGEATSHSLSRSDRAPVPMAFAPRSAPLTPRVVVLEDNDAHMVERDAFVVFELSGVSVAFANAMRRVMLGEVETMAVEVVKVFRNDSVMQDEVLAHRLGMMPIRVDHVAGVRDWTRHGQLAQDNCVPLLLDVVAGSEVQRDMTVHILAKELRPISWEAAKRLEENEGDRSKMGHLGTAPFGAQVLYPDVVLTKMKPRQGIHLLAYATKGTGLDHAKWSPVSTASYKMKPSVTISQPIQGKDAEKVRKRCPKGVFDIEDTTLVVAREGDCSMCRECIREDPGRGKIELSRHANTFIFKVETTGQLSCRDIIKRTLEIIAEKAKSVAAALPEEDVEMSTTGN